MPEYRRPRIAGSTIFFTVNLARRGDNLLVREMERLRQAVADTLASAPPDAGTEQLDDLALLHRLPKEIVLDNRPEGTSRAMFDWAEFTGVLLRFIEPGKPVQNAFVESFNGLRQSHSEH